MKSSSDLFPVTLERAESYQGINDDVYLLKPNNSSDPSVKIALSHITMAEGETNPALPPVILIHGSFTDRRFWLSNKGIGFSTYLANQGYDVWLYEHRGHGFSPKNETYPNNNSEEYAQYDMPAVVDFVMEQTGRTPVLIGHSLGALMNATALAYGSLTTENCQGVGIIANQVSRKRWFNYLPLSYCIARLMLWRKKELIGEKLGIGPANEPIGIALETMKRRSLFGRWRMPRNDINLLPRWSHESMSVPVGFFCGSNDSIDPAKHVKLFHDAYGGKNKSFYEFGTAQGFSKDYGHIDLIIGQSAAEEVWPVLLSWLQQFSSES